MIKEIIAMPMANELIMINPSRICYCQSDGNFTKVFLIDGLEYFISKQLKSFEKILPKLNFLRVHKGYIVNRSCIQKFIKNDSQLLLKNGKRIPLAKRKKNLLAEAFMFLE